MTAYQLVRIIGHYFQIFFATDCCMWSVAIRLPASTYLLLVFDYLLPSIRFCSASPLSQRRFTRTARSRVVRTCFGVIQLPPPTIHSHSIFVAQDSTSDRISEFGFRVHGSSGEEDEVDEEEDDLFDDNECVLVLHLCVCVRASVVYSNVLVIHRHK